MSTWLGEGCRFRIVSGARSFRVNRPAKIGPSDFGRIHHQIFEQNANNGLPTGAVVLFVMGVEIVLTEFLDLRLNRLGAVLPGIACSLIGNGGRGRIFCWCHRAVENPPPGSSCVGCSPLDYEKQYDAEYMKSLRFMCSIYLG